MAERRADEVRKKMRVFIEENFLYLQPELELGDDQDLLALGVVDSLGFVELVEEVAGSLRGRRSKTSRSPRRTSGRSTPLSASCERKRAG